MSSSNDPFGSVTPRRPVRPARGSIANSSTSNVSAAQSSTDGRYGSLRNGHASRASLSNNFGIDNEKTPRKAAPGASPLPSADTSYSKSTNTERSTSGGSKASSASSRATVGTGMRSRTGQAGASSATGAAGTSTSAAQPPSSSAYNDRSARRSSVISTTSARASASPALKSAPLPERKRSATVGDGDSFDADMSADSSIQRDTEDSEADISSRSAALDRARKERRRRSAMHAQDVQILRSESRLGSRQGFQDDDDIPDQSVGQSDESDFDQSRRSSGSEAYTGDSSGTYRRSSAFQEDDDLEADTSIVERHTFPQRPQHMRHDTTESSGTAGTVTDTSGTEGGAGHGRGGAGGGRGHSHTASRNYRNGDGHNSGSSTSGKRRRRKHSSASMNHQRRDSGAMRPSTSFEDRNPPQSGRPHDEFDQPHWQGVGARSRRISLTQQHQYQQNQHQQQQQRSRMLSTESDVTEVRESSDMIYGRNTGPLRRSPLRGGAQGHERSATMGQLDFNNDRPLSSQGESTYRAMEASIRRDQLTGRRHAPRLSVSRGDMREDLVERAYTPNSAFRSSVPTVRDSVSRTPDPNMSTGLVGGTARRTPSLMGSNTLSLSSRGEDLSSTVRPSLDGVFGGPGGGPGIPLCDRNMQRAFDQFETYFSFPSVSCPADNVSNPGSAVRPRSSSIATDAPTTSSVGSRSRNGAATPSTPTSGGGHSGSALAESVELVACFKAVTQMASELNSGLRRLRENVNEVHVDADVNNDPLASSLWRMGKDLAQLVKASDNQLRNLTEGLVAFKRADRERERVRRVAGATNSENGSVAGGGAGSSNRSNSRLGSLLLAQRSPGSESRRNGREAQAARASISEYRRNGAASTSSLVLGGGDRDRERLIASPTSIPSGRSSTASASGGNGNVFNTSSSTGAVSGARQLVGMQRQDSNNSGSTTTSVSPRPPDTPTPMPPGASGKQSDTTSSLTNSTLSSRLRSAFGDRLAPSGRHGRSASEVVSSPLTSRSSGSLSRAAGAGGGTTATVAEEPTKVRVTASMSANSIGRRAGASAAAALAGGSTGTSATSPTSSRAPPALSPRRARPALPALTKNG
ncbi:unnamed protein product [Tilletia controversa]|nr:unnamed protein product [Tilletia controversa]CAD6933152.1 unnamed protein product [Tilletia controversa]